MRRWLWSGALWALLAGLAAAQEPREIDNFPDMPADRFLQIIKDRPDGLGVSISWLKYSRIFNGELKVYEDGFQGLLIVRDERLQARLAQKGQDSNNEPLEKRQNIQVVGTGVRQGDGYVLIVQRVYGLEDDLARYGRRAQALPAADAAAHLQLVEEIRERARRSLTAEERPPVLRLAEQVEQRAMEIERAGLPALPAGAQTWLRFGQRYRQIDELAELVAHAEVEADVKQKGETLLSRLGARRYLGRWMSEANYHQAVGFAEVGDRTLPVEQVELRSAAEAQLKKISGGAPWPPAGAQLLLNAAQEGNLVPGQRKQVALLAIQVDQGPMLPVRIDRWRQRVEEDASYVWERWLMPDDRVLFFMQGRLFKTVD